MKPIDTSELETRLDASQESLRVAEESFDARTKALARFDEKNAKAGRLTRAFMKVAVRPVLTFQRNEAAFILKNNLSSLNLVIDHALKTMGTEHSETAKAHTALMTANEALLSGSNACNRASGSFQWAHSNNYPAALQTCNQAIRAIDKAGGAMLEFGKVLPRAGVTLENGVDDFSNIHFGQIGPFSQHHEQFRDAEDRMRKSAGALKPLHAILRKRLVAEIRTNSSDDAGTIRLLDKIETLLPKIQETSTAQKYGR